MKWIFIYIYLFNYLIILKFYASTRVVKNYSTPIWSRVLVLLELLGTALLESYPGWSDLVRRRKKRHQNLAGR